MKSSHLERLIITFWHFICNSSFIYNWKWFNLSNIYIYKWHLFCRTTHYCSSQLITHCFHSYRTYLLIRKHDIISPSQTFEHLCNAAVSVKPLGVLIHCVSLHCSIVFVYWNFQPQALSVVLEVVCASVFLSVSLFVGVSPWSRFLQSCACGIVNRARLEPSSRSSPWVISPSTALTSEDECHSPLSFTSCHCALRD